MAIEYLETATQEPTPATDRLRWLLAERVVIKSGSLDYDEFNAILREVAQECESEILKAIDGGRWVQALLATDSIKSAYFHEHVLRRYAEFAERRMSLNVHMRLFHGYTSTATLMGFNAFGTRRLLIGYYVIQGRLVVLALGLHKGKPAVMFVEDTDRYFGRLESIARQWKGLVELPASSLYGPNSGPANQNLFSLGVCNGEFLQHILQDMDQFNEVFISPHSFLNVLPMHIAFVMDGYEVYAGCRSVHVIPSLGLIASMEDNCFKDVVSAARQGATRCATLCDPGIECTAAERDSLLGLRAMGFLSECAEIVETYPNLLGQSLESTRYLHISCHGRSSSRSWHRSSIRLGDADVTAQDILTSANLTATSFCSLSACQTGVQLDLDARSDFYCGLDMAFMACGCPSIASTFWSVNSTAAMIYNLVFQYYAFVGRRWPFAVAHRCAIIALRDGHWKSIVQETQSVIQSGHWPAASCQYLEPWLRSVQSLSENRFANVLYWGAFKYIGW